VCVVNRRGGEHSKGRGNETMHNRATLAAAISIVLMCAITLAGTGLGSPPGSLEEVVDLLPRGTTRQELNQASMQLAGTIVTVPVCTMGSCRQYDACMDRCVFICPHRRDNNSSWSQKPRCKKVVAEFFCLAHRFDFMTKEGGCSVYGDAMKRMAYCEDDRDVFGVLAAKACPVSCQTCGLKRCYVRDTNKLMACANA
jgi:hypothetical protein